MKVLRLNEVSRRRQNLQLEQLQDIFPAPLRKYHSRKRGRKDHRGSSKRMITSPAALLAAWTYDHFHFLVRVLDGGTDTVGQRWHCLQCCC